MNSALLRGRAAPWRARVNPFRDSDGESGEVGKGGGCGMNSALPGGQTSFSSPVLSPS